MVITKSTFLKQQVIVTHWRDALLSLYPGSSAARVEAQLETAVRCLDQYLSQGGGMWNPGLLLPLLVARPSLSDVTRVFAALRQAYGAAVDTGDTRALLHLLSRLDGWIAAAVEHYESTRLRQNRRRWRDMVQRFSQLNTLSHCVAELNTSLDLTSVFTATVELGRLFSGADLCALYLREGRLLELTAYAGAPEPENAAVSTSDARVLEPLTVDRNHHDLPLETVCARIGSPLIKAVNCIPLQSGANVIGKLSFAYTTMTEFAPQELRLHEIYANHAAQAIANAQLYERLSALTVARERRHIACEIHDTLLQTLIALNINLRVMRTEAQHGNWDEALDVLATAQHLGKLAMQEGRDTLNSLRESEESQSERNLIHELQPVIDVFSDQTTIEPRFICTDDIYIPANVSHHLCRLVGEALTNIHRHARANHVDICITQREGVLTISVRDDGIGFQPAQVDQRRSFGLMGMLERARLIEAQVSITSDPGCGAAVTIQYPLHGINGQRRN